MNNRLLVGLTAVGLIIIGAFLLFGFDTTPAPPSDVSAQGSTGVDTTSQSTVTAPVAATLGATTVTSSSARVHGMVDPKGGLTTYWFEYSSDPLLGAVLIRTTPQISLHPVEGKADVEATLTGLTSSSTYYFRLVAANSAGTVRGERFSFTTK